MGGGVMLTFMPTSSIRARNVAELGIGLGGVMLMFMLFHAIFKPTCTLRCRLGYAGVMLTFMLTSSIR